MVILLENLRERCGVFLLLGLIWLIQDYWSASMPFCQQP